MRPLIGVSCMHERPIVANRRTAMGMGCKLRAAVTSTTPGLTRVCICSCGRKNVGVGYLLDGVILKLLCLCFFELKPWRAPLGFGEAQIPKVRRFQISMVSFTAT